MGKACRYGILDISNAAQLGEGGDDEIYVKTLDVTFYR